MTCCNTLQHMAHPYEGVSFPCIRTVTHCSALRCIASHCNALQSTATHCNTLQRTATHCNALQRTALHCIALHCTATNCNISQRVYFSQTLHTVTSLSATHCNTEAHCQTLQHTATRHTTKLCLYTQSSTHTNHRQMHSHTG